MNYRLIFGQGGVLDCTSDLDEMTERIRALSGDSNANAFRRYVVDNRLKLTKSKHAFRSPGTDPRTFCPSEPCEWPVCAPSVRSQGI